MQDELIALAARGDQEAFRRLFDLWFPKAYRIGKSICGCRSLAEDAVQEAMIRFWSALSGRRATGLSEHFFMKIVANEAKRIRARRKTAPEEFLAELPGEGDVTADEAEYRARFLELAQAVDRLPEKLGSVIRLRYYGGFTEAETAEVLGITQSCAKVRLLRGRQKLKEMLARHQDDGRVLLDEAGI